MKFWSAWVIVLCTSLSARAGSITIATFDDPAAGSGTPMFTYSAATNQLGGGWAFPGLTLETTAGTFNNATFSMNAAPGAGFGNVGAGQITFRDSLSNQLLRINFDSAQLNFNGFGATEFMATNNVSFSGSIVPFETSAESFSFAFANQREIGDDGSFSVTAAFTSSAVPEPASLALLAVGGLVILRRRRRG